MSFSARYVPADSVHASQSCSPVCRVNLPTTQTSKAPQGSVSGRVTIKDKGRRECRGRLAQERHCESL